MAYLRDGFSKGLVKAGNINSSMFVLSADLKSSTRCDDFAKTFPDRFIQTGIAEQNMMSIAAGLAMIDKIPFVNSFAVFNPGRNWDQFRVSVCYPKLNVKVVGHHSGFCASTDGATHQAFEDLAITRALPNLVILQPNSMFEVESAILWAVQYLGPVYIRLGGKYNIPQDFNQNNFEFNKAQIIAEGKDLTVVVSGALTARYIAVKKYLQPSIDIELISFSTLKPFDSKTLIKSVQKTKQVLTIEDHQITGGLGSIVAEVLSQNYPVKVYRHGLNDTFGESGAMQDLLKKYKLDEAGVIAIIEQIYKNN